MIIENSKIFWCYLSLLFFTNILSTAIHAQSNWQDFGETNSSLSSSNSADQYTSLTVFNGVPYVAYSDGSQGGKLTVKKFTAEGWQLVGSAGFSTSVASQINLAMNHLGVPYVVFKDPNGGSSTAMKYNGSTWETLGSSTGIEWPKISFGTNNILYLVFIATNDENKAHSMTFDGTSWTDLGAVSPSAVGYTSIAVYNNEPYIAYSDSSSPNNAFRGILKKYNGSTWQTIGGDYFTSNSTYHLNLKFNANGEPHVLFASASDNNKAVVARFKSGLWGFLNSNYFSSGAIQWSSLSFDSSNKTLAAFADGGLSSKASVKSHNGTAWSNLGAAGFSIGAASQVSIAYDSTNGITYLACIDAGKSNQATLYQYVDGAWTEVKNVLSNSETNYTYVAISKTGIPYMAYGDETKSGKISVRMYNSLTNRWELVGTSGFSAATINSCQIAFDSGNTPYVVFTQSSGTKKAFAMKFDGTSWVSLSGSGVVSANNATYCSIAFDGLVPYVCYNDTRARVRKFEGGNWVNVASEVSSTNNIFMPTITFAGTTPYVIYRDATLYSNKAKVYYYNGTSWVALAGSPSDGAINFPVITSDSNNNIYIAYSDSYLFRGGKMTVKKYNSGAWTTIGSAGFTSAAAYPRTILAHDNEIYVGFKDAGNSNKISLIKYNSSNWVNVGSAGFSDEEVNDYSNGVAINSDKFIAVYGNDNGLFSKSINIDNTHRYFRSKNNGDWNISTRWEKSADEITWINADVFDPLPSAATLKISISAGTTVSLNTPITANRLHIENDGLLELNTGNTLTLDASGVALSIAGNLKNSGSSISLQNGGTIQVLSGGKYQHNYTNSSGTIPTAVWELGSSCEIIGYTNFIGDVLGSNQNFKTFIWNNPNQSLINNGPSLLNGFSASTLRVLSTGTGLLNLATSGGTIHINNYEQEGTSKVVVNKTSGTLNLNIAGNLNISGGSFTKGNGNSTIKFNGSSSQNISATLNGGIDFWDVEFSGGDTKNLVSGSFAVLPSGYLRVGATTTLNTGNNLLTLKSNASETAQITELQVNAHITGSAKVERFINGGDLDYRTFRMYSSPVYDNVNPSDRKYNLAQLKNSVIVSGNGGTANGFDNTPQNKASAFIYDNGFKSITQMNTLLSIGKAVHFFYRGNRDNISAKTLPPFIAPESGPIIFSGTPNQHDVVVTLQSGGNLVGNPYAATIDWNHVDVSSANLKNEFIRVWNPELRVYSTYDRQSQTSTNGGSRYLASGQGFFVEANGVGTLTFKESDKATNQQPSALMHIAESNSLTLNSQNQNLSASTLGIPPTIVRLTLGKISNKFYEEGVIVFQEGKSSAYLANEDAMHLTDANEQRVFFSTLSSDNKKLAINYMPPISTTTITKLNLDTKNLNDTYILKIETQNLPAGYTLLLMDKYLNKTTAIANGGTYSFNINKADAASLGTERLSIIFDPPSVLSAKLISFSSQKKDLGVLNTWKIGEENNIDSYLLKRSSSSGASQLLYSNLAKGTNNTYSFFDRNPVSGLNHYSLYSLDKDGKEELLANSDVFYNVESQVKIELWPNPCKENLNIKFTNIYTERAKYWRIYNTTGSILLEGSVQSVELEKGKNINISTLPKGVYQMVLLNNYGDKLFSEKLLKE